MIKVNNKDTKTATVRPFWCLYIGTVVTLPKFVFSKILIQKKKKEMPIATLAAIS